MRTKRCMALILAAFMLLGDVTSAFADGVSANNFAEEIVSESVQIEEYVTENEECIGHVVCASENDLSVNDGEALTNDESVSANSEQALTYEVPVVSGNAGAVSTNDVIGDVSENVGEVYLIPEVVLQNKVTSPSIVSVEIDTSHVSSKIYEGTRTNVADRYIGFKIEYSDGTEDEQYYGQGSWFSQNGTRKLYYYNPQAWNAEEDGFAESGQITFDMLGRYQYRYVIEGYDKTLVYEFNVSEFDGDAAELVFDRDTYVEANLSYLDGYTKPPYYLSQAKIYKIHAIEGEGITFSINSSVSSVTGEIYYAPEGGDYWQSQVVINSWDSGAFVAPQTGDYYLVFSDAYNPFSFSATRRGNVKKVSVNRQLTQSVIYAGIDYFQGMFFDVTFSDNHTEAFEYMNNLPIDGISISTPDFSKPGSYAIKIEDNGKYGIEDTFEIEVKAVSPDNAPMITKGVPQLINPMYLVGSRYCGNKQLFRVELEKNKTYEIFSSNDSTDSRRYAQISVIYEDGLQSQQEKQLSFSKEGTTFAAERSGVAYILVAGTPSQTQDYLTIREIKSIEKVRLLSDVGELTFVSPIEHVNIPNYSVEYSFSDGSVETGNMSDVNGSISQQYGISIFVKDSSGNLSYPSSNMNPGTYAFVFCTYENNWDDVRGVNRIEMKKSFLEIPFTVQTTDELDEMIVDSEYTYYPTYRWVPLEGKTNVYKSENTAYKFIRKIYLEEGKTYRVSTNDSVSSTSLTLCDAAGKAVADSSSRSLNYSCEESGDYYLKLAAERSGIILAEEIIPITGIELLQNPFVDTFFYGEKYAAENAYASKIEGLKLRITLQDGTEEEIFYGDAADPTAKDSSKYPLFVTTVSKGGHEKVASGCLEPGEYEYAVKVQGCDLVVYIPLRIVGVNDVKRLNVGGTAEKSKYYGFFANEYKQYELGRDYFTAELKAGQAYTLSSSTYSMFEIRNSQLRYIQSGWGGNVVFTPDADGVYVIMVRTEDEAGADIKITKGGRIPVKSEIISAPAKTNYVYGIENYLSLDGLKVRVTFSDGTQEVLSADNDDWNKWMSYIGEWHLCTATGALVADDLDGRTPVGTYYLYIKAVGLNKGQISKFTIKVNPISVKKVLSLGEKASTEVNQKYDAKTDSYVTGASQFFGIDVIEGETYKITAEKCNYFELYSPKFEYCGFGENGSLFTAPSTGRYYISIYCEEKGTLSYEFSQQVIDAEITGMPRFTEFYTDGLNMATFWGTEVTVTYGDGRKEAFDIVSLKAELGASFEFLDSGDYFDFYATPYEAGEYKLTVTIPSWDGELYIPFSVHEGVTPSWEAGKIYEVPANTNFETYTELYCYPLKVEAGKNYYIYGSDNITVYITEESDNPEEYFGQGIAFTAKEDAAYYIDYFAEEDGTVTFTELNMATELQWEYVGNNADIYYGDSMPDISEYEFKLQFANGTSKFIRCSEDIALAENGIEYFELINVSTKKEAVTDKNGFYPVGNYEWRVKFVESTEEVIIPIAVKKQTKGYNVVFNANDEKNTAPKKQSIKANTVTKLTKNAFKRAGYEFVGWSRTQCEAFAYDADIEDIEAVLDYADNEAIVNEVNDGSDINLYAVWVEKLFEITYVLGGFEFNNPEEIVNYYLGSTTDKVSLPDASAFDEVVGFEFGGFYFDNAYKKPAGTELDPAMRKDITLYAKWLPAKYYVSFNGSGATGSMKNQEVSYGIDVTLAAKAFKSKEAFLGWSLTDPTNILSEGSSYEDRLAIVDYVDKASFDVSKHTDKLVDGVVTLYAVWAKDFKITYVSEKYTHDEIVSDFDEPEGYMFGKAPKLKNLMYTGYTFGGWFTDETYTKRATINAKTVGDVTLYAKFTVNSYNVRFNSNGGSGKMANQNFIYDVKQRLATNVYTKPGYIFAGWTTDAKLAKSAAKCANAEQLEEIREQYGAIVYTDGQEVEKLESGASKTITLNALWVECTYEMNLEANGGTVSETAITYKFNTKGATGVDGSPLELPTPERAGYDFAGWYTDSEFKSALNLKKVYGDVTLYARWNAIYTITFDGNGGTAKKTMAALTKLKLTNNKALPANTYSYTDAAGKEYAFMGWTTKKPMDWSESDTYESLVEYADKSKVNNPVVKATGDGFVLSLYAVWESTFNVRYNLNGGRMSYTSEVYEYKEGISSLPIAVREGYTFGGWYSDSTLKKAVKSITKKDVGDKELYAKWNGMKYTVTFDVNLPENSKKSGKTGKASLLYGTQKALPKNGIRAAGYTFLGWSEQPVATLGYDATTEEIEEAVTYADQQKVEKVGNHYKPEVTLYAVWIQDRYEIRIDENHGAGEIRTEYYFYGEPKDILGMLPSRRGYTFMGWYTDEKCSKKASNIKSTQTGNVTLYAKWSANK